MVDPEHESPWRTVSTRLIYANPWISVREDRVIRPDNEPGIYGVVHFPNRAVGVLPVDGLGRIWLVGQFRYATGRYSWEIPEGAAHPGESPELAAARELREETGLAAGRLEWLGDVHLSNSVTDELATIFRAVDLTEGISSPEGNERLIVRLVEWDEAWRMLATGEITDSMTVIALLHEAIRRGQPSGL